MDKMNISSAKYYATDGQNQSIKATIDGVVWSVPLDPANRFYAEIQKQVAAGDLTIQDAD
tara:strand:+ start:1035 stop:1214 length:180 start_codon:yes stop_codon:yes gene_type:complete